MKLHQPITLLLLYLPFFGFGQYTLQLDLGAGLTGPGGINTSAWTIQLSGPPTGGSEAYLILQLFDPEQQLIYEIKSSVFPLRGPMSISGRQFNFAETEFIAPRLRRSLALSPCLPRGNYLVIVQLLGNLPDSPPLAMRRLPWRQQQDCRPVLRLVHPPDRAALADLRPNFSWTPAAGPASRLGLEYEISLFELQPGQSPERAAAANPVWYQERAATTRHLFASLGRQLQAGRHYAWYVTAVQDGRTLARSEVWSFHYQVGAQPAKEHIESLERRPIFLKPGPPARPPSYQLTRESLHFFCIQTSPRDQLELEILDDNDNRISQRRLDTKTGHNYLSFSLEEIGIKTSGQEQRFRANITRDQQPVQSFFIHL